MNLSIDGYWILYSDGRMSESNEEGREREGERERKREREASSSKTTCSSFVCFENKPSQLDQTRHNLSAPGERERVE